jgi:hypothetical protein
MRVLAADVVLRDMLTGAPRKVPTSVDPENVTAVSVASQASSDASRGIVPALNTGCGWDTFPATVTAS